MERLNRRRNCRAWESRGARVYFPHTQNHMYCTSAAHIYTHVCGELSRGIDNNSGSHKMNFVEFAWARQKLSF